MCAHPETSSCRSVFQSGESAPAIEQFTRLWISMINQIEKSKEIVTGIR